MISRFDSKLIFITLLSILTLAFLDRSDAFDASSQQFSRRRALRILTGTFAGSVAISSSTSAANCEQAQPQEDGLHPLASSLQLMIPSMKFGAPATNATISPSLATDIEMMAFHLESQFDMQNLASMSKLSGSWKLLYSNAPEISNLAKKLPLGFALGPTYQPLDIVTGRFENRASVVHQMNIAKLETDVVGDVSVSELGTLNAIGVLNERGNRINVDFRCIVFKLDEILGVPLKHPVTKVIIPRLANNAVQPANDITFLNDTIRIIRGGDGSLFIFERDELLGVEQMLSMDDREQLLTKVNSPKANDEQAIVGIGSDRSQQRNSPELRFLFKDSR